MEEHEDTKLTNWKSRIYKENLENMKSFTRKRLVTMEKLQDETNLNKDNKRESHSKLSSSLWHEMKEAKEKSNIISSIFNFFSFL